MDDILVNWIQMTASYFKLFVKRGKKQSVGTDEFCILLLLMTVMLDDDEDKITLL